MTTEPVETFVFLPFSQYKTLDSRAKSHSTSQQGLENPQPKVSKASIATPSISKEEKQPKLERNVTKTYQSTQIQKILTNIRKTEGSEELTSLPHLDDLIKVAISNTRKKLPNEEAFFTFLFENGMGHFVKNRSKIDLYYKDGLWYQV